MKIHKGVHGVGLSPGLPPHFGQETSWKEGSKGEGTSVRSQLQMERQNHGEVFLRHRKAPHRSQVMMGIGAPQYLCLEIFQSRSLKFTVLCPMP